MKIAIYSMRETLYEGEAKKLIVQTPLGETAILDHHIPLISLLVGPSITMLTEEGKKIIPLASGFLEVRPESEVVILAH